MLKPNINYLKQRTVHNKKKDMCSKLQESWGQTIKEMWTVIFKLTLIQASGLINMTVGDY